MFRNNNTYTSGSAGFSPRTCDYMFVECFLELLASNAECESRSKKKYRVKPRVEMAKWKVRPGKHSRALALAKLHVIASFFYFHFIFSR